jgi:hypothetical protein
MGNLKNVPTATRRLGWTARIAGSAPGARATVRGVPPGGRRTARAGASVGVLARACRLIGGHSGVHPLGLARACRLQRGARAGASDLDGAGPAGHRASQGTPERQSTHSPTQGQISEAVLRYHHEYENSRQGLAY